MPKDTQLGHGGTGPKTCLISVLPLQMGRSPGLVRGLKGPQLPSKDCVSMSRSAVKLWPEERQAFLAPLCHIMKVPACNLRAKGTLDRVSGDPALPFISWAMGISYSL